MSDFWVFGYGSLIWKPGFEFVDRQRAVVHGLHRSLCVYSWVHRGTKENPGLVLGLDRGGCCAGVAMRATANNREEVIDYLRKREQITDVYVETWRNVTLANGENVTALLYRVDQSSLQYAQGLSLDEQAKIVIQGKGGSGHNTDYVANTVEAMRGEGIKDRQLEYVNQRVVELKKTSGFE